MPAEPVGPVPLHAADDPTPYRRSLRASRARRAVAARRTRCRSRGRRSLTGALVGLCVLTGGAFADATAPAAHAPRSPVAAAQAKLGVAADGTTGPVTRHAVRAFQRTHGLVVDGIIGPRTLGALGVAGRPTAAKSDNHAAAREAAAKAGASPLLEAIALCESGGDPSLVSASGEYRGKYQFNRQTWRSVGGKGDPAAATEAEQDGRATRLMAERGPSAWPVCSKKAGA